MNGHNCCFLFVHLQTNRQNFVLHYFAKPLSAFSAIKKYLTILVHSNYSVVKVRLRLLDHVLLYGRRVRYRYPLCSYTTLTSTPLLLHLSTQSQLYFGIEYWRSS